jgi:hypothetical protein
MGPEGSLLYSQERVSGPYPEPDEFSPYPTKKNYFRSILIMDSILQSTLKFSKWSLPFRFSIKNFYAFLVSSMCAA